MKSFRNFLENAELQQKRKELGDRSNELIGTYNASIQKKKKLNMIKRLRDRLKKRGVNDIEATKYFDDEERMAQEQ
tara:strand:+ start:1648 stop:1875 length:228 start_codon:yes stop_codon:yes gene_type:complete